MKGEHLCALERKFNSHDIKLLLRIANGLNLPLGHIAACDIMPETTLQEKLQKSIILHAHRKGEAAKSIGICFQTLICFLRGKNVKNCSIIKIKNYIAETEKAGE